MTDSDEVKLLPCPWCQQELELIESWAKSFNTARLYREYHHRPVTECILGKQHWTFPDTAEKARQAFIATWNTRPPVVTDEVVERVANIIAAEINAIDDELESTVNEQSREEFRETASQRIARKAIASMPAVVSGGQT